MLFSVTYNLALFDNTFNSHSIALSQIFQVVCQIRDLIFSFIWSELLVHLVWFVWYFVWLDWIYEQYCIGDASVGYNKPLTQALKKCEPLDDILKRGVIVSANYICFLTSESVHHTATLS
jgi:hypothetical protein